MTTPKLVNKKASGTIISSPEIGCLSYPVPTNGIEWSMLIFMACGYCRGYRNTCIRMTSSNGNIFCVTDPLWGEFTGHRWIPLTKASDAKLWSFLWSAPERRVEQTTEMLVIRDAIALIMTSLLREITTGKLTRIFNIGRISSLYSYFTFVILHCLAKTFKRFISQSLNLNLTKRTHSLGFWIDTLDMDMNFIHSICQFRQSHDNAYILIISPEPHDLSSCKGRCDIFCWCPILITITVWKAIIQFLNNRVPIHPPNKQWKYWDIVYPDILRRF